MYVSAVLADVAADFSDLLMAKVGLKKCKTTQLQVSVCREGKR